MDPSTTRDPSATHYEQVCQGLRSFYVCVIEDESSDGSVGLLTLETSLRHARFEDAVKHQQNARSNSKSWIAECTIMDGTEMEQDPVTIEELVKLFDAMSKDAQTPPWRVNTAKRRVAAWLKQSHASTSQPF
jgi:hypothetical protein